MPTVSTTYTTAALVQKILGLSGVSLRVDDDTDAADWSREEASVEIEEFLLLNYTSTALAASNWVARTCAWLAAGYLCLRRLNAIPSALAEELARRRARLEQMRLGQLKVPDAMPRKGEAPVLSNQRVRLRPIPQAVTERGRSTGTPANYPQHDDWTDQYIDYTL